VADQLQTEVTENKAEVLPKAEAPKAPAPAKEKEVAPAAKAAAPQPKRQPAPRAAARTVKRAKPARKPTARKPKPAKRAAMKPSKAAKTGARLIKTGVKTMANKTNETGKIATEQFTAVLGDVNARAKTAFEKSAKIVEEFANLTRGNVEAMVASSKVAAKGVETLGQDAADYSRKSFEDASAAFKSFAEVKSATDFFRLQGDYARSAFDAAVAESARLSETVLKLAGDVAEPINSRYAVAADRVKTLAA
jgi:phasin family protein